MYKKEFVKEQYTRKRALTLWRQYNEYQLDYEISPALAQWFNVFMGEEEDRHNAGVDWFECV